MENKKNQGSKPKQTFPLPPKKQRDTGWKKWVKFVWMALIAVIIGIAAVFFATSQGFLGSMPDVKELENPDIYVASEIYSSDGKLLGKFEKYSNTFGNYPFVFPGKDLKLKFPYYYSYIIGDGTGFWYLFKLRD